MTKRTQQLIELGISTTTAKEPRHALPLYSLAMAAESMCLHASPIDRSV